MNFKQWLSNQSPKTFAIVASTPGKFVLRMGFGGQTEGEIDNLSKADLEALQQYLNQMYPVVQSQP